MAVCTAMNGPGLHIGDVAQLWSSVPRGLNGNLDQPVAGAAIGGYDLHVSGWIVDKRLQHLEVQADGEILRQLSVETPRPDIARLYGDETAISGFGSDIRLLGRPGHVQLDLVAVDTSGGKEPVATVELTKSSFPSPPSDDPAPMMITTIGRSGSSWISALLGSHSAILTYRPMQVEPRVASYWCQIFVELTTMNAIRMPLDPRPTGEFWWRERAEVEGAKDADLEALLLSDHVRAVGTFCQQRVAATCAAMGQAAGRNESPRFFAEKCQTDGTPWMIWELFPNARELVLVRDPRDILASVLAFNEKRGYAAFGRESHESDESYISEFAGYGRLLHRACTSRGDRALIVRYEDLVENTGEQLIRVLTYLGLERDKSTVAAMLAGSPDGDPAALHRTTTDARASIGRWRIDLPPRLRKLCDEMLTEPVLALGYEP